VIWAFGKEAHVGQFLLQEIALKMVPANDGAKQRHRQLYSFIMDGSAARLHEEIVLVHPWALIDH
jgi:hypothetical protein